MKIGVFGGSFNPVHYGHLILAEHAADAAGLDEVILIPAYESPFKMGTGGEISEHDLEMVRIAASGNRRFKVSQYEVIRKKTSYTVDTLRELSRRLEPSDRLYFIMGADSFCSLEKWRGVPEMMENYSFVVGRRPGCSGGIVEETAEKFRAEYDADIIIVPIPQVDISSTDIRERVSEGRSIRYLTPDSVVEYIKEHGLYQD